MLLYLQFLYHTKNYRVTMIRLLIVVDHKALRLCFRQGLIFFAVCGKLYCRNMKFNVKYTTSKTNKSRKEGVTK